MDVNETKNFRPVSNLPFLETVIEKEVRKQMCHDVNTFKTEKFQPDYTKNRSTETALLDELNNVYKVVDKGYVVCLEMLDLSTTFDTVSHDLLLNRLEFRLEFVAQFLSGCTPT